MGTSVPAQVPSKANALLVGRPLDPCGQFWEGSRRILSAPAPATPSEWKLPSSSKRRSQAVEQLGVPVHTLPWVQLPHAKL